MKTPETGELAGTVSFQAHSGPSLTMDSTTWFLDSALQESCSEDHSGRRTLYARYHLLVCTTDASQASCLCRSAKHRVSGEAPGAASHTTAPPLLSSVTHTACCSPASYRWCFGTAQRSSQNSLFKTSAPSTHCQTAKPVC